MARQSLPDTRGMLPGKAREAVTEFILEQFEKAPRNSYNNPIFDYATVLGFDRTDSYLSGPVLIDCYGKAKEMFEARHPLRWSNEKQESYRD